LLSLLLFGDDDDGEEEGKGFNRVGVVGAEQIH